MLSKIEITIDFNGPRGHSNTQKGVQIFFKLHQAIPTIIVDNLFSQVSRANLLVYVAVCGQKHLPIIEQQCGYTVTDKLYVIICSVEVESFILSINASRYQVGPLNVWLAEHKYTQSSPVQCCVVQISTIN